MLRDAVVRVVDFASRRAPLVVAAALALLVGLAAYASRLEVRSDLLELLPRDSPGFQAFEHQLGRLGGSATLIVIVSSPDRASNERFVDDLSARLDALRGTPDGALISYVESGTKDVRAFYERNKWLYADLPDLEEADRDLDHEIAVRSGLVDDLEASDAPAPTAPRTGGGERKEALGIGSYVDRWDERAASKDTFPTGYFASEDGTLFGVRMVTKATLGDARGDALLSTVERIVRELGPARYEARMTVGFTGDIASASDEKRALVSDAVWVTLVGLAVLVVTLALYYRSVWALPIIALPTFLGVAAAYAFAEAVFGYVNTSGAFLGIIILGNGINYPIVLLSRYYEFRARGMVPDVARREAVINAFRAELVGACVASIAYGSLLVTRFRGFSQFGAIGFVGMLFVWASIVPLVPALLVLVERLQARLPRALRPAPHALRPDGARHAFTAWLASATGRRPRVIVIGALAVAALLIARVPSYLADPWQYDFGKLGSRRSDVSGAGEWSNKANVVFGGKMNVAGATMLADTPEQVPLLKAQILENDRREPGAPMIVEILTVDDLLPGTRAEQVKKLSVLARIRARLSPRVLWDLHGDELSKVLRAKPPETLRVLGVKDLPPLLERRFTENDGRVGTIFYVKPRNDIVFADGHNHLRMSRISDNVKLPSGTIVQTASRSTIFAEMLESIRRDGPLASCVSFGAVIVVVIVASRDLRVACTVLFALLLGVVGLLGVAAWADVRIQYIDFIAFPITFGIGCEYPFNIADRTRLLGGDVREAMRRSAGAVMLCSFTTIVGYGSLLFSDFQALEAFGKLAVAGEIACVLAAVLVLPALLSIGRRGQQDRIIHEGW